MYRMHQMYHMYCSIHMMYHTYESYVLYHTYVSYVRIIHVYLFFLDVDAMKRGVAEASRTRLRGKTHAHSNH